MATIHASNPATVRIGTWNTKFARSGSRKGKIIRDELAASNCDVLCVTEGFAAILPPGGSLVQADPDWGYTVRDSRRKVILWSRQPWTDVDAMGSEELPPGRFLKGVTQTSCGTDLTVIGVCIPWRDAHVRTGSKDRRPWQDHEAWLVGFEALRSRIPVTGTVVLGDFNQKIPRTWAPRSVYQRLLRAFDGFEIATSGNLTGAPSLSIDHIAHTPDMPRLSLGIWQKTAADGTELSDHFGVWCDFRLC